MSVKGLVESLLFSRYLTPLAKIKHYKEKITSEAWEFSEIKQNRKNVSDQGDLHKRAAACCVYPTHTRDAEFDFT